MTGEVTTWTLGGEPTRIASSAWGLLVTDRVAGELVMYRSDGTSLIAEVGRIPVGTEPFDVAPSADGRHAWVSLSQEDRVVEVDLRTREVVRSIPVADEPRWLSFVDTDEGSWLMVGSARGDGMEWIRPDTGEHGRLTFRDGTLKSIAWAPESRELLRWRTVNTPGLQPQTRLQGPVSEVPPDVIAGRRLFAAANDAQVSAAGSGVRCAICHVDGRTDGWSWTFPEGQGQTPSLAGAVSHTVPLGWDGGTGSIAEETEATSSTRMGGAGMGDTDLERVAAYVDWVREVRRPAADAELVALGAEVFHRADVGCAGCHQGEAGDDGQSHAVLYFEPTNTPPLRGVGATAPYLHDGSALTLREVLLEAREGGMGDTSQLTPLELDALEAYLRQR